MRVCVNIFIYRSIKYAKRSEIMPISTIKTKQKKKCRKVVNLYNFCSDSGSTTNGGT